MWRGRDGLERADLRRAGWLGGRGDVVHDEDRAVEIEKESQIRSRLFPRYQTSFRVKIFMSTHCFPCTTTHELLRCLST
jgi:hypothetical protein